MKKESSQKKTIFITSFQGLISRIFECGVLKYLTQNNDIRVVIFVPDFKVEYFESTFKAYKDVYIEGIDQNVVPRRAHLFHKLTFLLLDSKTMRLFRRSSRDFRNWPRFLLHQGIASYIGRWRIFRELFRLVNYIFSGKPIFNDYFQRYQPDLVVALDVKHILDTALLIEAKKRKVGTVGMVRSWDYLTAKGIIRVKPDKMIVHNNTIRKETVRYADMKDKDITVVGMPHFDPYINYKRTLRTVFLEKLGIDPKSKIIFLGPIGDKFCDTDSQIFQMIQDAIHEKRLPENIVVLVRVHPGDTVSMGDFASCKHFYFDYPGVQFEGLHRKASEMNLKEILHLADSLYRSDVAFVSGSTICIDAAALGVPIVFRNFDGYETRPYYESVNNYYDYQHVKYITQTSGYKMAHNMEEMISHINSYLSDKTQDEKGRKQIILEQCWKQDGKSSKRIADFIRSQIL